MDGLVFCGGSWSFYYCHFGVLKILVSRFIPGGTVIFFINSDVLLVQTSMFLFYCFDFFLCLLLPLEGAHRKGVYTTPTELNKFLYSEHPLVVS